MRGIIFLPNAVQSASVPNGVRSDDFVANGPPRVIVAKNQVSSYLESIGSAFPRRDQPTDSSPTTTARHITGRTSLRPIISPIQLGLGTGGRISDLEDTAGITVTLYTFPFPQIPNPSASLLPSAACCRVFRGRRRGPRTGRSARQTLSP